MSMGDIFFWIGVLFGGVAVLVADLAVIIGWLIYEKRKERRRCYSKSR